MQSQFESLAFDLESLDAVNAYLLLEHIMSTTSCLANESSHEALAIAVMVHVVNVVREFEVLIPTVEVVYMHEFLVKLSCRICLFLAVLSFSMKTVNRSQPQRCSWM